MGQVQPMAGGTVWQRLMKQVGLARILVVEMEPIYPLQLI